MINNKDAENIIDTYVKTKDIELILSKYNYTEQEIRQLLKDNNIDRVYNYFKDELYDRIVVLYQRGLRLYEIEDILHISEGCINKTLANRGIQKRTTSENNIRFYRNRHYFDSIDTPNKAYVLGLLYADGNNLTSHNTMTISLQECDKKVLERIKEELEYEGDLRINKLHEKNPNYKNQYILCINDEIISKRLAELGIVDNKSLILKYPEWMPKELERHFMRGYFDGDGCVYYDKKRNKTTTNICGTLDMCEHFSKIMWNMGCKNNIRQPKQSKGKNTYVLRTAGNKSSYKLLSYMYDDSDIKMERKYQLYLNLKDYYVTE